MKVCVRVCVCLIMCGSCVSESGKEWDNCNVDGLWGMGLSVFVCICVREGVYSVFYSIIICAYMRMCVYVTLRKAMIAGRISRVLIAIFVIMYACVFVCASVRGFVWSQAQSC